MARPSPFDQIGPALAALPVLISVPHAGRDYPAALPELTRLGMPQLMPLEDRYADLMLADAVGGGAQAVISRVPRLWIDLNRDVREFDPVMIVGDTGAVPLASAKVRGGLGLVPRKVRDGEIWRHKLPASELQLRIADIHMPYHTALADRLAVMKQRFGVAVLLDLHSMPPVVDRSGEGAPQIVIGDRFGRSAHGRFTARALAELEAAGYATSVNVPYAGGHILDRHGNPSGGVHAIQIEIDRRLYLDASLEQPGPGLAAVRRLIARLVQALADEACAMPFAIAAE